MAKPYACSYVGRGPSPSNVIYPKSQRHTVTIRWMRTRFGQPTSILLIAGIQTIHPARRVRHTLQSKIRTYLKQYNRILITSLNPVKNIARSFVKINRHSINNMSKFIQLYTPRHTLYPHDNMRYSAHRKTEAVYHIPGRDHAVSHSHAENAQSSMAYLSMFEESLRNLPQPLVRRFPIHCHAVSGIMLFP